jgi:2-polyprenyl-3-methyl-5-hydroxy-6-metoxy-1,4-benzoquinol methylase
MLEAEAESSASAFSMLAVETEPPPAVMARPPRPVAWVLLSSSAAAVLLVGLTTTVLVLSKLAPSAVGAGFWSALAAASGLTIASLGLRALRWVFLLRRADTRIPIRDAYIGYLSGLTLLLAPFLLGEVAIRAFVHRSRVGVPAARTAVVNLWERFLDLVALAAIAGCAGLATGQSRLSSAILLAAAAGSMFPGPRRLANRAVTALVRNLARADANSVGDVGSLIGAAPWATSLLVSIVAWMLPGVGLWIFGSTAPRFSVAAAQSAYALSTLTGALALAPAGVLVAGSRLLDDLRRAGFGEAAATLSVFGIRLATAGVATMLGGIFLLIHFCTRGASTSSHFDAIANAYDVQIPEPRRRALLKRKTELMGEVLTAHAAGASGLDAGCGQGWYVARMCELGYDVSGIDTSPAQLHLAAAHVTRPGAIMLGSVLEIPAPSGHYDFVYTINVLHHLSSLAEQRAAFSELFRVLRPGGLLFVHEINTRNVLFRFYMGYVFPSLNCIDEGVERWLRPDALATYTTAPVIDVRYFTFLPEFLPDRVVRLLAPLERRFERSRLRVFSAHYMAVLRKATWS